MNRLGKQMAPWWLVMQLWGLDAPVAALCWAVAYADLLDIPMVTSGPLLLLASAVWLFTIAMRLYRAVALRRGWYVHFYRGHLALFLLLLLSVAAATVWMLFCSVGQIVLVYACFPFMLLLLGYLPLFSRSGAYRGLCHAAAFAMACSVPAAFYCVLVTPLDMLVFSPTWHLAILLFLYYMERYGWMQAEDAARLRGTLIAVGLLILFLFCLMSAACSPLFERPLYVTIAIAVACLEVLVRQRPRLSHDALFSLGWLTMALPPLLGMLLF